MDQYPVSLNVYTSVDIPHRFWHMDFSGFGIGYILGFELLKVMMKKGDEAGWVQSGK